MPPSQVDLVLVAWAKTIEPSTSLAAGARPVIGARDALDMPFWDEQLPVLAMWGRMNYGMAVIIPDGCAIDKDYNTLFARYCADGMPADQAEERALMDADPFIAVAEAWPVEALPEHRQREAESGAIGYIPFLLPQFPSVPKDARAYAVDLSRIATVSWRAIHRRIAIGDDRWRQDIQVALCRFFAARTIRVNEELAGAFQDTVVRVEALTPPAGNPPRTRVRLQFSSGKALTLEAILDQPAPLDEIDSGRPGLTTRG